MSQIPAEDDRSKLPAVPGHEAARIMIVEDERIVALNLEQRLRGSGYQVVANVSSGERALTEALTKAPELVLMDIRLSGELDGVETAERIKAELDIPVIFLTANADEITTQRAGETDAYGFLLKPVDPRELHAAIQIALTRHHGESAIRDAKERLELAMNAAGMASWELETLDRSLHLQGRPLELIFGTTPEGINLSWDGLLERIHDDDRGRVNEAIDEALARGEMVNLVFRSRARDGAHRWVRAQGKVFQAADRPLRLIGVMQDITHQREAEEQLRQAATVFEATGEAIIITDAETRIVAVNPAFTRITGYSTEEAIGQPTKVISSGTHDSAFYEALWGELMERGQWSGEIIDRRKDGSTFTAWENITAIRDADGQISHFVAILADITAAKNAERRLRELAYYDPLTGLPNRSLFLERLKTTVWRAKRHHDAFAVLFIDLDRFKHINDTLGHAAGDDLLRAVADRFQEQLREADTLARLGGDEFTAIIEDIERPADVARVAEKLIRAAQQPVLLHNREVVVTASVGIAIYPDDGNDASGLLRAADIAMYSAKEQGRDLYRFCSPQLFERASHYMHMANGLRQAMSRGDLALHYQPQITTDGRVTGIEALLRWERDGQAVSPEEFIPIAEEIGLISQLGEWVLRRACTDIASLRGEGLAPPRIAVNVSVKQLLRGDLESIIGEVLDEAGLSGECLEIEVTESALQTDTDAVRVLNNLKRLGVTIAVDDFGMGYSCLTSLKELPIDCIKIDRTFVRDVLTDPSDAAITNAVIQIAASMDLRAIAEGVESEAQLDHLTAMGCGELQGYLISRPLPFETLREWLRAHRQRLAAGAGISS